MARRKKSEATLKLEAARHEGELWAELFRARYIDRGNPQLVVTSADPELLERGESITYECWNAHRFHGGILVRIHRDNEGDTLHMSAEILDVATRKARETSVYAYETSALERLSAMRNDFISPLPITGRRHVR